MKKVLMLATLIGGFSIASFANTDGDVTKAQFIENCIAEFPKESGVPEAAVRQLCDCTADNVYSKMTKEEIKEVTTAGKGKEPSTEVQMKMMEVMQPCLEELMTQMQQK